MTNATTALLKDDSDRLPEKSSAVTDGGIDCTGGTGVELLMS